MEQTVNDKTKTAPSVAGTTEGQLDKNNNISLPEFFRDDKV